LRAGPQQMRTGASKDFSYLGIYLSILESLWACVDIIRVLQFERRGGRGETGWERWRET